VLEKVGMKQDSLKGVTISQLKYFGHIKRHDSLLKNILEGRVEGKRAKGRQHYIRENDGLEKARQSVPAAQETDNVGDPLWPTFDAEMALNLNLNVTSTF
jgi:hypothetical protein